MAAMWANRYPSHSAFHYRPHRLRISPGTQPIRQNPLLMRCQFLKHRRQSPKFFRLHGSTYPIDSHEVMINQ